MKLKTLLLATCLQTAMFVSLAHASLNSDGSHRSHNNSATGGSGGTSSAAGGQGGDSSAVGGQGGSSNANGGNATSQGGNGYGGVGGNGGTATGGTGGTGGNPASSISVNNRHKRQVPTAYAQSVVPDQSCALVAGIGGGSTIVSISFGKVTYDYTCVMRVLENIYNTQTAQRYGCLSDKNIALAAGAAFCPGVSEVNFVCRDRECM